MPESSAITDTVVATDLMDPTEVDTASSTMVVVDTDPMEDMASSTMEVAVMDPTEATDTVNIDQFDLQYLPRPSGVKENGL